MKVFTIKLLTFILVLGLVPFANCKKKNAASGWEKTFGGKEGEWGYSIQQTKDGGFIITGLTQSFGPYSIYLLKVDGLGNFQKQWTFGSSNMDRGYAVRQTRDGGYILTGWLHSTGVSGQDIFLIKMILLVIDNGKNHMVGLVGMRVTQFKKLKMEDT